MATNTIVKRIPLTKDEVAYLRELLEADIEENEISLERLEHCPKEDYTLIRIEQAKGWVEHAKSILEELK